MTIPTGPLLDLVAALDRLGSTPSLAAIGQALQQANLDRAAVDEYVRPNPRGYNRVPVVVREHYDLLVMTWLPGQASVPHDHSGSICAMRVLQGRAVESCYRLAADGYADLEYEAALPTEGVAAAQDAGIHSIRNVSPDEPLVTVHIYAPRLRDVRQFRARPATGFRPARLHPHRSPTVVVVGGGFSGSMVAAQVLRRSAAAGQPAQVVLVERRGAVGEGVAYGTPEVAHLLNVPAGRMSAWPDQPADFAEWAARRQPGVGPADFLPRAWYGEYVRECLLDAADQAGPTAGLTTTIDEVRRVARHPAGGWMVHLARHPSVHADAVVLAVGHRPPSDPFGGRWQGPRSRLIADPWLPYATNTVGPDDPVLVLGTGLTAVDAVLSLTRQPRRAPITLVSRNGLLPQAHSETPEGSFDAGPLVAELLATAGGVRARDLVRAVRRAARGVVAAGGDWRAVVNGLRPHTAALWQAMAATERRRFLTRLRPFWEVHRHRMAPAVARAFESLRTSGIVNVVAGAVVGVEASAAGVRAQVRGRGGDRVTAIDAQWVINCTGPLPSNSVESNPVIGSLLVAGLVRPDALGLGLDTTADGRAVARAGDPVPDLFVVGTLRKAADWESTAVPELRQQAAAAAEAVSHLLANPAARTAA